MKTAIDKFLNWLEAIKNKSPKTVEQYARHLKKFQAYIEKTSGPDFEITKLTGLR